jgi:hypothetical protein
VAYFLPAFPAKSAEQISSSPAIRSSSAARPAYGLHEVKHDGFCILARKQGGECVSF